MFTKTSEVWKSIAGKCPENVTLSEWQRSYDGISAAIAFCGFDMVTTRLEFESIPIPVFDKRQKHTFRKIIVKRDGVESQPTRIIGLLTGNSSMKTVEERSQVNEKRRESAMARQPKGSPWNNDSESDTIDRLDVLIDCSSLLFREHLYECRIGDIAYCLRDEDISAEVFSAEQMKTAIVGKNGNCLFHCNKVMTVLDMVRILQTGLALTCIGKKSARFCRCRVDVPRIECSGDVEFDGQQVYFRTYSSTEMCQQARIHHRISEVVLSL